MSASFQVNLIVLSDIANSFFLGDAAGRPNDHSSTDRKLALNIGIPFHTPEAYFLGLPEAPYTLPGFHVSTLPQDGRSPIELYLPPNS